MLSKNNSGCPYLFLAPMEGVGDSCFRKAISTIGGFDEAVTEFIRVPRQAHVESLAKVYNSQELFPIPIAAQLMGSDPELMAAMAREMEKRGAPRIDLNCGCPSNTVTGRGAGSSLLKEPTLLHDIAKAMKKAVSVPISIKMRSGYEDISLFKENLLAAQESGACFITLHPRTKVEGYTPPARWDLIAEAKRVLSIPLVGNGDILSKEDALRMLKETSCDALMIGRGSLINPFIFEEIKAHFSESSVPTCFSRIERYIDTFIQSMVDGTPMRTKINKVKQLLSFIFKKNESLRLRRNLMLRGNYPDVESFVAFSLPLLKEGWESENFV